MNEWHGEIRCIVGVGEWCIELEADTNISNDTARNRTRKEGYRYLRSYPITIQLPQDPAEVRQSFKHPCQTNSNILTNTLLSRLTRELEKKFSDRNVVFIAQRRILPKPGRRSRVTQKRPRSRTLSSVHEKILEDLVYPTEIVGRRIRTKEDGSKVMKVLLDPKDVGGLDWKVEGFAEVYKKLTGRSVVFEFPVQSEF